ncbi:MAG: YciK family oxidoreductase [Gammaproteobacteria bacterium]|nr:MAG: YciK family oxidoreductase [Gammaproteobacteria bacterium]
MKNKIILITGAGDGLGRELSMQVAKIGGTIILLSKNKSKIEAVYDKITEQNYPTPALYPLDLSEATEQDYKNLATEIFNEFGKLDLIIHNAAFFGTSKTIIGYEYAIWQKVMQTNLNAPYLMTKYLYPLLQKTAKPQIYFTIDNKNTAYFGAYAISKNAIKTMVKILANELSVTTIKIQVNGIIPPVMRTNMRAITHPADDFVNLANPQNIAQKYIQIIQNNQETGQIIAIT